MKDIVRNIILICLIVCSINYSAYADNRRSKDNGSTRLSSSVISIPRGLEGRVEFWLLIFTKYGKDHRVFHNRSYPEIIYSILDFSEYERNLTGKALMSAKLAEAEAETERIKSSLLYLAGRGKPRNEFERRIEKSYKAIPGHSLSRYREGAEPDIIRYQTGIKERFRESLIRSGRYLRAIEHTFEEQGLPPELGRIPFVESSFDYTANSSVGAAGIWQFMPATAKRYMTVNNNLDERRDPIIATRAAAQYLKNAYVNTNSWPLAVTSYNHGLTGVIRAMRAVGSTDIVRIINNYEAKSFGFASSNFYAEFLAALMVDQNEEKYFPGIEREDPIEFDEIRIPKSVSFKTLVQFSGASAQEIKELNLSFKDRVLEGRVSIPAGTFVKVPHRVGNRVVAKLPGARILASSREYKTKKSGSKIGGIDEKFLDKNQVPEPVEIVAKEDSGLDLGEEISKKEVNELGTKKLAAKDKPTEVSGKAKKTQKLDIAQNKPSKIKSQNVSLKEKQYKVKKGDTISGLSRKLDIPQQELMKKLKIKSAKGLKIGMKFGY